MWKQGILAPNAITSICPLYGSLTAKQTLPCLFRPRFTIIIYIFVVRRTWVLDLRVQSRNLQSLFSDNLSQNNCKNKAKFWQGCDFEKLYIHEFTKTRLKEKSPRSLWPCTLGL